MDTPHADNEPCCGACGHAEEVTRSGRTVERGPPLQVSLSPEGVPRNMVLRVMPIGGQQWEAPLEKAHVIIGRDARMSDVVLKSMKLSRQQCFLDFTPEGVMLSDARSGCGTFVNGLRISRTQLREGDTVYVADFLLRLQRVP